MDVIIIGRPVLDELIQTKYQYKLNLLELNPETKVFYRNCV